MSGLHCNNAISLRMLTVFPKRSIKPRHQGDKDVRIGEPMLLTNRFHYKLMVHLHGIINRRQ